MFKLGEFAKDAEALGADALMVLPAMVYVPTELELEHHFRTVAAATSLPIFMFALPAGALADLIDRRRLLLGLQVCAGALAAVHAAGVVYRDLHPGNVLIDRGTPTRAWLFDFDQAQVSADFYAALTERWATPPEERHPVLTFAGPWDAAQVRALAAAAVLV